MKRCLKCGNLYDENAPENIIRTGKKFCPKCLTPELFGKGKVDKNKQK